MIRNDELSLYITVNIFSGIYVGVQVLIFTFHIVPPIANLAC